MQENCVLSRLVVHPAVEGTRGLRTLVGYRLEVQIPYFSAASSLADGPPTARTGAASGVDASKIYQLSIRYRCQHSGKTSKP
jgi:hypothetical protein